MDKFKIGDEVKRLEYDHVGCRVGESYTVRGYARPDNILLEGFDDECVFMDSKFELFNGKWSTKQIDTHYNFTYTLSEEDIKAGVLKCDPYFVGSVWKTGSRDDTGVLFHSLKTIARFGDKNDKAREIKALYLQAKRLAELNGVNLND